MLLLIPLNSASRPSIDNLLDKPTRDYWGYTLKLTAAPTHCPLTSFYPRLCSPEEKNTLDRR